MVFRIALYISFITVSVSRKSFISSLLFLLASLSFAILRPYKNNRFNIIDCLLCAVITVGLFFQSVVIVGGVDNTRFYQIIGSQTVFVPLVYITCYVLYCYIFTPLYRRAKRERQERHEDNISSEETDSEELPHQLLDSPTPPARWHSDTIDYITNISQSDHSDTT